MNQIDAEFNAWFKPMFEDNERGGQHVRNKMRSVYGQFRGLQISAASTGELLTRIINIMRLRDHPKSETGGGSSPTPTFPGSPVMQRAA